MKTAVITGVSSGIGKEIAQIFLDNDWKVYGLSRSKPNFSSHNFVWLKCDLSKGENLGQVIQEVEEDTIDALVSNAGIVLEEPAASATASSYEKTYGVNVLA